MRCMRGRGGAEEEDNEGPPFEELEDDLEEGTKYPTLFSLRKVTVVSAESNWSALVMNDIRSC